jgi:hypothetical protein
MGDCTYPEGMSWKPDGVHDVDPCVYQDIEMHTNATVIVSRCVKCGKIILSWLRTEDTEDIDMTEEGGGVLDE